MRKLTLLAAATTAMLGLVGCGGGSDSNPPDIVETQSLAGKAADGYLRGATVCLDLNNNLQCDDGEPTTQSGAGGAYQFDDLDADLDLTGVRVVVEVIAGATIDEDQPDTPVAKAYRLSAPPGRHAFVSPLTTMIDVQMQLAPELSEDEAKALVKQQLGVDEDKPIDLYDDYVERKSDSSNDDASEYERLHDVAKAVTRVVANNLDAVKDDVAGSDRTSDELALLAIISNVSNNVGQLIQAIDEAKASGDPLDIDAVVEQIQDQLQIAIDELEDLSETIEDKQGAQTASFQQILQQEGGIFFLNDDDERSYNAETQQCQLMFELGYGQFQLGVEGDDFVEWYYNSELNQFVQDDSEEDQLPFVLTSEGWQQIASNEPEPLGFSEDGMRFRIRLPWDGVQEISARVVSLAGQPLVKATYDAEGWMFNLKTHQGVFGEGAEGYWLTSKQIGNHYLLPVWQDCGEMDPAAFGNNCNTIWPIDAESPATSIAALINDALPAAGVQPANLFHVVHHDGLEILAALFSVEGVNTVAFYKHQYQCYEQMDCNPIEAVGSASWSLATVNGVSIVRLRLPSWLVDEDDEFESAAFLTEQGGFVRRGFLYQDGDLDSDEMVLNQTAMNQLLNAFDPTRLSLTVEPAYCGVYDDSEPDDGGGGDDGQSGEKPVLSADPGNTALLEGALLFGDTIEGDRVLVHFASAGELSVVSDYDESGERYGEREQGSWSIDANGQLLLEFEQDWVLIKVISGLGSGNLVLEENGQQFSLMAVNAVEVADLTGASLTALDFGEQCVLSLSAAQDGTGSVNLSSCPPIRDEEGVDLLPVEWALGDFGEFVLMPPAAPGELNEAIHLFYFEKENELHVIMVNLPVDEAVVEWDYEAFSLWLYTPPA